MITSRLIKQSVSGKEVRTRSYYLLCSICKDPSPDAANARNRGGALVNMAARGWKITAHRHICPLCLEAK